MCLFSFLYVFGRRGHKYSLCKLSTSVPNPLTFHHGLHSFNFNPSTLSLSTHEPLFTASLLLVVLMKLFYSGERKRGDLFLHAACR